ncbi:uncharacterized protein [Acropora muricata]|uniref:uncharacterized protein n=1 Tax=Acropora muricata TaxID=159855 RepID=UPI0034E449B2
MSDSGNRPRTPKGTHLVMTWGQFLVHDVTLTELTDEHVNCGTNAQPCPNKQMIPHVRRQPTSCATKMQTLDCLVVRQFEISGARSIPILPAEEMGFCRSKNKEEEPCFKAGDIRSMKTKVWETLTKHYK